MKRVSLFFIIAVIVCAASSAHAASTCVVVSKKISPYLEAFKGMKAVLGGDIDRSDLEGKREKGGDIVGAILQGDCKVVVPIGSLALDVVRVQITDRPIVYSMVASPSPAISAAKNITGIAIEPPPDRLLSSLKRLLPNVAKVGMVYDPANAARFAAEAKQAAARMGIALEVREASSMRAMAGAVDGLLPRVDALMMAPDPTTSNRKAFEYLLLESTRRGIPLIGLSKKHVRDGALFAFDISYGDVGRKTGELVRSILDGRGRGMPGDGSAHGPLIINLKTAKRLGLHIDGSIVDSAAQVYE